MNDFKILDVIPIEKGGYCVMDKGYIDFEGLYRIKDEKLISTRLDTRIAYKDAGIICDQDIQLISIYSNQHYPVPL
ncbi:hypothetical protein [Flavihumibacter sp. UBA7668]|uniref:hypothetical protein n=1 Tax=Flavihumibacter sp. UBA7668 TaxID=1946542 RepID=UPI0025C65134|nr:hypothetical protein [Flavihumibacter sp. UBA7668]